MAKTAKSSVTVAKRASSPRVNRQTPLQNAATPLQNALKAKRAPSSQKRGAPAQNQSSEPAGLARILRPQASQRWTMPHIAAITPQYVEMILRGALAGDHARQWELFDMMLDTWPELAACRQELAEGVMAQKITYSPFCEDGEPPTDSALERQKLVSSAMRRMQPDVCADENDLNDTLADILDGWFRGVVCLETDWFRTRAGALGDIIAPRATFFAHPQYFAWGPDGRVGLRNGSVVMPFPPHKFLLGIHKAKAGSPLGCATLRPLAWWWCAANFASDWLLNLAQLFGLPFRWANHDVNASQETIDSICNMLQNMGSAGWAAFPAGTTLDLKDTGATGDRSPQGDLLDRADRYARTLLLGQTLSGSADASKGGGKAFGSVEADVKNKRIDAAARYACKVLNSQLIPSILVLNYGDRDECPCIDLVSERQAGTEEAQRDAALAKLFPLSIKQLRQKYELEEPADEEDSTKPESAETMLPITPITPTDGENGNDGMDGMNAKPDPADPALEAEEEEPADSELMAKLAHISAITDDALFAKALSDLAATL